MNRSSQPNPSSAGTSASAAPLLGAMGRSFGDLLIVSLRILALLLLLLIALPVVLLPLAAAGVILVIAQFAVGSFAGHYRHLIMQRLMRRKLIPLFAAVAVALCTAMVIIVLSVMGGFLDMLRGAGSTLMGDVSISAGLEGFPHYQEMMTEIEKLPEVAATAPLIHTGGLLRLPGDRTEFVQVFGIDGRRMAAVSRYESTLVWTREKLSSQDIVIPVGDRYMPLSTYYGKTDPVAAALDMTLPWKMGDGPENEERFAAMVSGLEVNPYHVRRDDGSYIYSPLFGVPMLLTVVPLSRGSAQTNDPSRIELVTVNEFTSGLFETDSTNIFVPFSVLQKMLLMHEQEKTDVDDEGNRVVVGKHAARTSFIYVKGKPGVDINVLRDRVDDVFQAVARKHNDMPPGAYVATWEQRQAQFINTVENEKRLMAFLFGLISLVSVVMVGVIFYTIVTEKTRDIGVLRALGASQAGVASIFLGFGASIGAIGMVIGCVVGCTFVLYINEIHAWLGSGLSPWAMGIGGMSAGLLAGIVIVTGMFSFDMLADRSTISRSLLKRSVLILLVCIGIGLVAPLVAMGVSEWLLDWAQSNLRIVIWDRSVYFFERIPAQVNPVEILVIAATAVIASIVGALLPAVKAAMVDPVESLRYE